MNNKWQLQEAKSKFSQLVDSAIKSEPQIVTKHGENAVVVMAFDEYKKLLKPKTDLVSFFRHSPIVGLAFDSVRSKDIPRDFDW